MINCSSLMRQMKRLGTYILAALILAGPFAPEGLAASAQNVYDSAGRLVQVIQSNGASAVYNYDAAGNLLSIDRITATTLAITSFGPARGTSGTTVTVWGSGFSTTPASNTVTVNGTSASVTASTKNNLTIVVPATATTGRISVSNSNGSSMSSRDFVVDNTLLGPAISGISPTIGPAGTSVTISGGSFLPVTSGDRVFFGGTLASTTGATSSAITSVVGAGSVTGKVRVDTPYGSATSSQTFFIPPGTYAPSDVASTGQLTSGTSQAVTISSAGKIALYSFEGTAGQKASILINSSSFSSCSTGALKVYSPDGGQIASSNLCSGTLLDAFALGLTGTYTVAIIPATGSTGSATFTVNCFSDATAQVVVDGTPVALSTSAPGQNMAPTFTGAAQQRIALTVSSVSGFSFYQIKIRNPDGTTYALSSSANGGTYFSDLVTLTQAGTYTIILDPTGSAATSVGSATFALATVASDATSAISVDGSPVTLTTTTPAQNMTLTFSGTALQRVSLTVSGVSAAINYYQIKIRNPDGSTNALSASANGGTYFSDLVSLTQTGTHTIIFDPASTAATSTGAATFTLRTVAADASSAIVVDGAAVPLSTTTPAQNMLLTFSGAVAQRISLTVSGVSGISFYQIKIRNPDGTTNALSASANGGNYFSDLVTLTQAGTHTVIFDPAGAAAASIGSATFQMRTVAPDATGSLVVDGALVPLTTTTPAQNIVLTFSGSASQKVKLAVTNVSAAISFYQLKIRNPDGTSYLLNTSVNGGSYTSASLTLSQTGAHTVILDPSSTAASSTGSATFGLTTAP